MSYQFQGNIRRSTPVDLAGAGASRRPADGGRRSLAQTAAGLIGLLFLLVGMAGFIPGLTSDYDELKFLGVDSQAELLGLFQVSVAHNVVHLLFGIGLLAAARYSWSVLYLVGGGLLYAGVTVYGFVVDEASEANFLPINHADNLLHLWLSLGMVLLGLIGVAVAQRAERRGQHN